MKKLAFLFLLLWCVPVQAGEIRVKISEGPFQRLVGCVGFINRVFRFNDGPVKPVQENITHIVDSLLPMVSQGRISKLSTIPAQCLVMKDEVIFQIDDAALRTRMDQAFSWLHVQNASSEEARITAVSNYCLQLASRGLWDNINDIPAEVLIRFDDPSYERE